MGELVKEIFLVNIEDELKQFYFDYVMSVIVGWVLLDVCDGLKLVYCCVFYVMSELGNDWNKFYKKFVCVVGDVIGKYYLYGDIVVYDIIVCMVQLFLLCYMLVDGQGNFGLVDGDNVVVM